MTKWKQQKVSDDNVTSVGEIRYFDPIPVDLVINILSRLPVKTIAKCRCVSKLWSSIIRRPNYNQLFPIKSPSTPRLLFIGDPQRRLEPELCFYSSPEPLNQVENSSYLYPRHDRNFVTGYYYKLCPPVAGLVCRQQSGKNYTLAVISNPVTGEYVTTPRVATKGFESKGEIFFGYDPIDKQFKVLCMTFNISCSGSHEYQVLTLGTGNLSWRKIHCCTFHYPPREEDKGICIDGVLYYIGTIDSRKRVIVCFDVRSEKFSFIDIPDEYLARKIPEPLILIDYKGELGVIHCAIHFHSLSLWVLKDAEEHKWSEHFYKMPRQVLRPCLTTSPVYSAGMISSGEIVLYHKLARNPFYIFCYNLEKNIITSVGIVVPALDWVEYGIVQTFSNFIEDVKLI